MESENKNIQVEYGEEATPYTQYNKSIAQESGEAEDKVMSQKVVSDKLSDLYLQNFCGTESKNLFDSSRLAFNGSVSFIDPTTGGYMFEAPDGCKTSHLIYLRPKQTKITISSTFRFDNVFGYKFTDATGKTLLFGSMNGVSKLTLDIPSGAKFFQFSFFESENKNIQVEYGEEATSYTQYPHIGETIKEIIISKNDSEEEVYLKLKKAVSIGNILVKFETGHYVFSEIFPLLKSKYNLGYRFELPIGNGCTYDLQNSIIESKCPADDGSVIHNQNVFGSYPYDSSYTIKNGTIINNGGNYCVHDEASPGSTPYIRKYENVIMEYHKTDTTAYLSKCIGGGTGYHGTCIVNNCIFTSENDTNDNSDDINKKLNNVDISWHGIQRTMTEESTFRLFVNNSYFSRGIGLQELGDKETAKAYIISNSYKHELLNTDVWEVKEFNNVLRVE